GCWPHLRFTAVLASGPRWAWGKSAHTCHRRRFRFQTRKVAFQPMIQTDLETAALLRGIETIWQRAGLPYPSDVFPQSVLAVSDEQRLALAERLTGGPAAPDGAPLTLQSIFASLSLQHTGKAGYLPVASINVSTPSIYPAEAPLDEKTLRLAYRKLCAQL